MLGRLVVTKGGVDVGVAIHFATSEDVGVHVQHRLDALEHLGVALLRQDEEAADGEVLGVESAPSTTAVIVLVLLAALAHLLPEAQRGAELLEDHAYSDPGCVGVQLGDGEATTESLDHLEELVGALRDVLEPLGRPLGPRVFAVFLYLARGAVAHTVRELDVHVVYGALIRYCRARGDAVLLLHVDVEDVVEPTGGGLLLGSAVLVHAMFLDEIESAMGCLVRLLVKVQKDRPATRLELTTHEERVVVARSRCVIDLFGDLAERRSRAADLLMTV